MLSKYKWVIAGGALLALGCYYLSAEVGAEGKARPVIGRAKALQVAKELKKEMTPLFITLASFAISIREKLGGRVTDQELQNILMSKSPIPLQIQKAETRVYSKHNLTQADFQHFCEEEFADDQEIQGVLAETRKMMENAFQGLHPRAEVQLPEFFTAEFTLRVLEELYDVTKYHTLRKLEELHSNGIAVDSNSLGFSGIAEELEEETSKGKQRVFESFGMEGLNDSPNMLMHVAMQRYKEDFQFISRLQNIEERFERAMNGITAGNLPTQEVERLEEKFGRVRLIEELQMPRQVVEEEVFEEVYS